MCLHVCVCARVQEQALFKGVQTAGVADGTLNVSVIYK